MKSIVCKNIYRIFSVSVFLALASCGGGGSSSAKCGGPEKLACIAGSFCEYADLSCGESGLEGTCQAIPLDCSLLGAFQSGLAVGTAELSGPVCSCQGLDFFSICDAAAAAQSVRGAGEC